MSTTYEVEDHALRVDPWTLLAECRPQPTTADLRHMSREPDEESNEAPRPRH